MLLPRRGACASRATSTRHGDCFTEALKSKKRSAVILHRALLERARCSEAQGKRALARKDLERILADDATYDGLKEALAELDAAP